MESMFCMCNRYKLNDAICYAMMNACETMQGKEIRDGMFMLSSFVGFQEKSELHVSMWDSTESTANKITMTENIKNYYQLHRFYYCVRQKNKLRITNTPTKILGLQLCNVKRKQSVDILISIAKTRQLLLIQRHLDWHRSQTMAAQQEQ